jgi:hypothetical protein
MERRTLLDCARLTLAVSLLCLLLVATATAAYSDPRSPQGIYAKIDISDYIVAKKLKLRGDDGAFARLYNSVLRNRAISGLALQVHWDWAQPNPSGRPNWSYIDVAFNRAAAWRKTIQLIVTAGFNSPQWVLDSIPSCAPLFDVFAKLKAPHCGTVTFDFYAEKTDRDNLVLPLPWNPVYISKWHAFLRALEKRYGSNSTLVAISAAGPTAASAEMILPNNFNTCSTGKTRPCEQTNGYGRTAEQMWNVLFQHTSPDPVHRYAQNSDEAFIQQWKKTIEYYEGLFGQVTIVVTPGAGFGLPSFGSGTGFKPSRGNVLYNPECEYSYTGGPTYIDGNFATRSCDAVTEILVYFMHTSGGPKGDLMASQTSGMTATPLELGRYVLDGDSGDVGVPGVKYLSGYSGFPSTGPRGVAGGAQFDHPFSGLTKKEERQEGCWQGQKSCKIDPAQAEYNVLKSFFYGTRGATSFGGPTHVGGSSQPTPRFLQVYYQDVLYAHEPTSCAVRITDPVTGARFKASTQDLLNAAHLSLFGLTQHIVFPPQHTGC